MATQYDRERESEERERLGERQRLGERLADEELEPDES